MNPRSCQPSEETILRTLEAEFRAVPQREVKWAWEATFDLENPSSPDRVARVRKVLDLCARGVPFSYALGNQEFLGRKFVVRTGVLIPRFETESLVSQLIDRLSSQTPSLGLEIGVGSGAISISLLLKFPNLMMVATECSEIALEVARENARNHHVSDRLTLFAVGASRACLDPIVESLRTGIIVPNVDSVPPFDFLVSNPPYLDPMEPSEVDPAVRVTEPAEALFPRSNDPMQFYQEIAADVACCVKPGGLIALEIASERAEKTRALFPGATLETDLAGKPRYLFGQVTSR